MYFNLSLWKHTPLGNVKSAPVCLFPIATRLLASGAPIPAPTASEAKERRERASCRAAFPFTRTQIACKWRGDGRSFPEFSPAYPEELRRRLAKALIMRYDSPKYPARSGRARGRRRILIWRAVMTGIVMVMRRKGRGDCDCDRDSEDMVVLVWLLYR